MFSLNIVRPDLTPSLDRLDRLVIGYLTLPLVIFLIGWFEWWVSLPLIACFVFGLKPLWGSRSVVGRALSVTSLQLLIAVVVGCGWTVFGGADHLFFANADWHIRDAVLHDLVNSPWPVGYGMLDGKETLLRAPIGFYLPAALAGKCFGLVAAHVAMGLWTAAGSTLFLLQVLSLTPARPRAAITVAAVVVFFSGLDIVGNLLNDGPRFRSDWNITTHLEWWAGKFQYSSMTTQLFWVPNHALGGWLSIGLLCRNKRCNALNLVLPMIVVALALWSPLTTLGFVPFVLLRDATDSWENRSFELLHPKVWLPAMLIGIVTAGYLALDSSKIPKGLAVGGQNSSPVLDLLQQAQFYLLEAGFIGAAIFAVRRSGQLILSLIILALLPLVYLGPGNDLVMRASIPSLAVLAISAVLALVDHARDTSSFSRNALLVGLLVLGAMTPIAEFARAIFLPAWPINLTATLIGADCGRFAPHYVARMGEEVIGQLMRPINQLPLGPLGPQACDNPAQDLMWTWRFTPRRDLPLTRARAATTEH